MAAGNATNGGMRPSLAWFASLYPPDETPARQQPPAPRQAAEEGSRPETAGERYLRMLSQTQQQRPRRQKPHAGIAASRRPAHPPRPAKRTAESRVATPRAFDAKVAELPPSQPPAAAPAAAFSSPPPGLTISVSDDSNSLFARARALRQQLVAQPPPTSGWRPGLMTPLATPIDAASTDASPSAHKLQARLEELVGWSASPSPRGPPHDASHSRGSARDTESLLREMEDTEQLLDAWIERAQARASVRERAMAVRGRGRGS